MTGWKHTSFLEEGLLQADCCRFCGAAQAATPLCAGESVQRFLEGSVGKRPMCCSPGASETGRAQARPSLQSPPHRLFQALISHQVCRGAEDQVCPMMTGKQERVIEFLAACIVRLVCPVPGVLGEGVPRGKKTQQIHKHLTDVPYRSGQGGTTAGSTQPSSCAHKA